MKNINLKNIDSNFVIKGTFVLVGLFFTYKIISPIFKGLGLIKDPEAVKKDIELNQSIQQTNVILSSVLIQELQSQNKKYQDLEYNKAKKLSQDFYNAWSFGILDEKILLNIFSQLKYQSQISVLSAWFEGANNGRTLSDHISTHLGSIFATDADREAISQIFKNIIKLPLGIL